MAAPSNAARSLGSLATGFIHVAVSSLSYSDQPGAMELVGRAMSRSKLGAELLEHVSKPKLLKQERFVGNEMLTLQLQWTSFCQLSTIKDR